LVLFEILDATTIHQKTTYQFRKKHMITSILLAFKLKYIAGNMKLTTQQQFCDNSEG